MFGDDKGAHLAFAVVRTFIVRLVGVTVCDTAIRCDERITLRGVPLSEKFLRCRGIHVDIIVVGLVRFLHIS